MLEATIQTRKTTGKRSQQPTLGGGGGGDFICITMSDRLPLLKFVVEAQNMLK